jgi:Ca-activated chloride channel family protein
MRAAGRWVSVAVSAWLVTAAPRAQSPGDGPRVQIVSPQANSYVSGSTTLRAEVDPAAGVTSVTFYTDGRQACTVAGAPYECEWDAGANVTEHQIRVVVSLADGGRVARTLRTKGLQFAEKVDVSAIQVTVTVTDDNGRFVGGIPRSAFHVFEDSQPQTISNFASEDVPLELVVAVDISGSMMAAMPKLKKAVKEFLAAVPAKNQVTLLGFNDSIFTLTRKSTNPDDRARAVDRLAAWGATALYDVIAQGIDMLGRQIGRKALIVFSDGEDLGSHVTLGDVERRLQSSDVTLYMIGEGRGTSVDRLKRVMERLAAPTGGRAFTTDSVDELHGAFDELLDELSHQYLLGYQATNSLRDDTWREIRVDIDGRRGSIRARQGYRASPNR